MKSKSIGQFVLLLGLVFPVISSADQKAIFAGGCFWCVEAAFQDLPGVTDAISGFTGGTIPNPTYNGDHRGHYEAVEVTFDPETVSYKKLLEVYWHNVDPFDPAGQFCDKGPSYRAAIFTLDKQQAIDANASLKKVSEQFPAENVVTEILPASRFYPVERYHQDYYLKNPIRYRFYKTGCRRESRLSQIWGDSAVH